MVSRTPLREALVERGLLLSDPGRGFLVPPLDPVEASQLYPLVASSGHGPRAARSTSTRRRRSLSMSCSTFA
jgi:hypothetical protein